MNRVKHCPVCGELVAVYQGDPDKYGDKAVWNYYQFIRMKYDCDECREMMKGQSNHNADQRYRERRREQRTALLDLVGLYREQARVAREEIRLSRKRIAELEARI